MIIAIDFDHTICDTAHPIPGKRMGLPMEGCKDALTELKAQGHTIIIHTVRGDSPQHISDFMQYYELPFDSITDKKPSASLYVDDKGLYFKSWEQTMAEIKERLA